VNLADGLRAAAERDPDAAAIVFQGRAMSFGDLDDLADRSAAAFAGLGVGKGDRVALVAGNVPEFVSSLYGILRAGGVVCPLNVQMTPEELGYILADAGARVAVTEVATLPPVLAVRDRVAYLETVLVIGGPPAPSGTLSLEEALGGAGDPPVVATEPTDLAVIAYTSGTTASPKGAMLTHGNLTANLDQLEAVPSLAARPGDVVLVVLPLFHSYALNTALNLAIRGGATSLLVERFDPGETLDLIHRHGVTVVVGAPPMYAAWLAAAEADHSADLSTVRLATSGAAALPPGMFDRFRAAFGVTICEGYGLTEAAPAVTATPSGAEAKPGSIGPPLPGVEVRLVDADGDDADEDDPGEILIRGPNVFAGYWGRPEATAEAFDGEWLRTGDVAVRDDDGYLFLVDRKKDLIIVSGFNVYPHEVEDAIERDPRVAEVAVVGVHDERTGEAVQAWVVPAEGRSLSPEDVLDWLHGLLARFKWPREVLVVDALPHLVTGKVLRRALRAGPAPAVEVADE
jgi:long-chain acyl-CoA synthetase